MKPPKEATVPNTRQSGVTFFSFWEASLGTWEELSEGCERRERCEENLRSQEGNDDLFSCCTGTGSGIVSDIFAVFVANSDKRIGGEKCGEERS
jgi:hypothetical protein